jgi:hypothetical protein
MENKLIPMILFYLEDGEKMRHQVTNKIKNYPKELRAESIEYVINEKLVRIFEQKGVFGRHPLFIELTAKGKDIVCQLPRAPEHKTVWSV